MNDSSSVLEGWFIYWIGCWPAPGFAWIWGMINDAEFVLIFEKYYDYAYSRRLSMKKISKTFLSIIFLVILVFFLNQGSKHQAKDIELWPELTPFKTGYLQVSGIHQIYYELSGNRNGKPVIFLHGGPGGSCSPYMRRFSDPEKFPRIQPIRESPHLPSYIE